MITVWPPIYLALFMPFMMFSFASLGSRSANPPMADLFRYILPLHFLTMLLMFVLTAVYVVHAFRNDELASDKRTLWVIVLFFGNMFAFPVYWWFYIRPSRTTQLRQPNDQTPTPSLLT